MSSVRKFKKSRSHRTQFKSLQKKVWSVRQSNFPFSIKTISKKNISQLNIFDQKAFLALYVHGKIQSAKSADFKNKIK